MPSEEEEWQRLIDGLRQGDGQIIREFCERYATSLGQLADHHMTPGLQRRVDPEDVVQSVCRTFLRRVQVGQFRLSDSESLWQLLCAITLTKVREQARFHLRRKRGIDQEAAVSAQGPDQADATFQVAAPGPSPAEAAAFADQYQQILASMEEEERNVVELKLQECTNEEAAARLGISERTVRRIVKRVQDRFLRAFADT